MEAFLYPKPTTNSQRRSMKKRIIAGAVMAALAAGVLLAVINPGRYAETLPLPTSSEGESTMTDTIKDKTYIKKEDIGVIYLAGGCFWGMEKLMQSIPGVTDAVSGYANGNSGADATYKTVSGGNSGFRETVRVEYNTERVSLDAILFTYFDAIDPALTNRQGNDVGSQYQTGVYYADEESGLTVKRIADVIRARSDAFNVELKPLKNFYDAEDYHQNYLDKNPGGYCHISPSEFAKAAAITVDPADYIRPSDEEIKAKLTDEQYAVTQEADTERPFTSPYFNTYARGIYVDIVTGEPLFSSSDKYESSCGWPSFSKPIDENTIAELRDSSFGMTRTEVRSRAGNSHLGHVFEGDTESPTGTRYCINGASLHFVAYEDMDKEGYGYLKGLVK
jgi:peptide methionine sulfoxide reductase msrA/msrB